MKKLIFLCAMLTIALMGYSQATPYATYRVAARTTAVGKNLPAGTQIYCVADSSLFVVKAAGLASTATINTALQATTISYLNKTKVQNSGTRGATGYGVAIDSTKATYQSLTIAAATTSYAGVLTAADKTKLDGLTTGAGQMFSESFEATVDSLTAGTTQGFYTFSLTNTPTDSLAFAVAVNGVALKRSQFRVLTPALASKKLTINVPIYLYDAVNVSYTR